MFKKITLTTFVLSYIISLPNASAANLIDVYQQALTNDPVYQQAISQSLADKEGVPISLAALLPSLSLTDTPSLTRTQNSGPNVQFNLAPVNDTLRSNVMTLTATQTVFNFAQFSALQGSRALSKQADATLNAATQSLITRVASAYFAILQDEDNLAYAAAAKNFYEKAYDQINQQYQVGLKTITDVYTAQASYDSAVASYIAAENQLSDDKENLRAITGHYYPSIARLSEKFPYITPKPQNIDEWEKISLRQNWSIKASQYAADAALSNVRQQFAGHLPNLNVQGIYSNSYSDNTNRSLLTPAGADRQVNRTLQMNLNVPILAGGGVVAQTNQATYNYQVAMQVVEQNVRQTINSTRQSYLNIISGISKIRADKQAIKSSRSSLEGMVASYKVGTETLVDVLNQQQALLDAQKNYATDRYAYVNSLLALKQAAGTLGLDDVRTLNTWLIEQGGNHASSTSPYKETVQPVVKKQTKAKITPPKPPVATATPAKAKVVMQPPKHAISSTAAKAPATGSKKTVQRTVKAKHLAAKVKKHLALAAKKPRPTIATQPKKNLAVTKHDFSGKLLVKSRV